MRQGAFRFCMLVGGLALLGVAVFYFGSYVVVLKIALANSGVQPFIQQSIRALWLSYACQSLLIGMLYLLVSYKPHAVSRPVIVIFGLMQLVESIMLFTFNTFTGSKILAGSLIGISAFVLLGAVLWPKKLPKETTTPAAPALPEYQGGTDDTGYNPYIDSSSAGRP